MNILYATLLLVTALMSIPASAQEAAVARQECSSARSHVEMRACIRAKMEESARELRKAEDEMRKALRAWREEPRFIQSSAAKFEDSIKEFHRYRQAQCELSASLAAGGNSQDDLRLSCISEVNSKRVAQIKQDRAFVQ